MQKILVIQTAFIGDAILTLPLLSQIIKKYEYSEIDVLAIPSTIEIFRNSPYVNKVIEYDKRKKDKGIFALIKLGKLLKSNSYDIIFSPHRSLRSSILVKLSGVKETYGFDNSSCKLFYKNIIKYNIKEHEVLRNLRLINFDDKKNSWKLLPELKKEESTVNKIDLFIEQNTINNFICIAPGSVWETKKYPIEYYKLIAKYFINKGYKIIVTGSNSEKDLCNQLEEISNQIINTAGLFNINETIELIGRSKLLICNDSAPTHFGMVNDVKVLTLYCSTVAEFGFYPYNRKSKYLSYDNLKCKPCGIHGFKKCPIKTFDCGINLKPEIVMQEAEKLLNDF
ncbi:MAG TPA: glycosyltransferase family 9 protein [Melioribacteraceae bacterium]|nr:glycosyltransferase family 9 protein [Melioribacteraceae bacterium]